MKINDKQIKRERAERNFEDLLNEIFEADDALIADTSNSKASSQNYSKYWFALSIQLKEPCLSNTILITLEDSLRKLKSSSYLKETMPFEYILNLYKLLERSIENAENSIGSTSDLLGSEIEKMENNALICDNALKSMKVIFRIFMCERSEANLIPEELFNNIINLLSKVMENYILPLSNTSLSENPIMQIKGIFGALCQETMQIIDILCGFISSTVNLSGPSITKLEFLSIKIIFYESVSKPKDSLFGSTNIESLRVSSMRLVSILYGRYPEQRAFILDEILGSFTNLPVSKNARQFRLANGVTIQLVSALIMKLVQTCGSMEFEFLDTRMDEAEAEAKFKTGRDELAKVSSNAISDSSKSAAEVTQYLLTRAMKTTKSDDAPFRTLIDMFLSDFLNVLPNPEWPAAELLLYTLSASLTNMLETDKDGVLATTMALELLGTVASKLWLFKQNEDKILDLSENMPLTTLNEFSDSVSSVLLYLQNITIKDSNVISSYRYFLTLYTSILSSLLESVGDGSLKTGLISKLNEISVNGKEGSWLDYGKSEPKRSDIDPRAAAYEAYDHFLYSRSLSRYYDIILASVLRSLNHSKTNMRTKSLRVISQLLAQSPEIFSLSQVQKSLSERLLDSSSQVRDAAVDIVGKYIILKPEFAKDFYMILCERSGDTGLIVRKRVVKLLKDIYTITTNFEIKVEIADRLVRRVEDEESSVSTMAVSILTEFFFPPIDLSKVNPGDVKYQYEKKNFTDNVTRVLETVWRRGDRIGRLLKEFFAILFHPLKGNATAASRITAKMLVEELTERVSAEQDGDNLDKLLGLLAELVNANGSFVTQNQLGLLLGYIVDESASSLTPLACYYVLSIFNKSLEHVGPLRPQFLSELQTSLLKRLSKFSIREQSEAIPCLWKVMVLRKDTKKIANVALSCLKVIETYVKAAGAKTIKEADPKFVKLSSLLGNIGRHCDVDASSMKVFASIQTNKPSATLDELIIRKHLVFCDNSLDPKIRKIAVKTICNVCITHRKWFLAKPVLKVLDEIMEKNENQDLTDSTMKAMIEFLCYEEDRANFLAAQKMVKKNEEIDLSVFHGIKNNENEGASTSLTQRYLLKIIAFATSSESDFALTATWLLDRIMRQGLANPRLAAKHIFALEASRNKEIALVAKNIHAKLHDKYESLIEGSYVDGVKTAAAYRIALSKNLVEEYNGLTNFYGFLKDNRQSKRKFLLGLGKVMDFKLTDSLNSLTNQIQLMVFLANSISTMPFTTQEEVLTVIHVLDKVVSGVGATVHSMIEEKQDQESLQSSVETWSKLGRCALLLHIAWRTRSFLKMVYNQTEPRIREFIPSKSGKEAKPISRTNQHVDKTLNLAEVLDLKSSMDDDEANQERCKKFMLDVSPEALNPEDFQDDFAEDKDKKRRFNNEKLSSPKKPKFEEPI